MRNNNNSSNRPRRGRQQHSEKPFPHKRRSNGHKHQKQQPPSKRVPERALEPVNVSKNSIHSHWKICLGGIIRYYINQSRHANKKEAENEIESMYYKSGCSVQDTKEAILNALGATKKIQNEWIDVSMAVEKQSLDVSNDALSSFSSTADRKGVILRQMQRTGEGPAHAHETWNNIVVPSWGLGKSFFFQVRNNSPINLSCEMILDGYRVAKNVPLPRKSTRTVRPDASRYFEAHKWILRPATRVKLQKEAHRGGGDERLHGSSSTIKSEQLSPTRRYNGIRPDYRGKRVSLVAYPDPTSYGWNFTGSVQESSVEFFERGTNMGTVKMDFYYTKATVKTVLMHPSTGRNCLFRNTVSGEDYIKILKNPRSHTGRGYRRRDDRPGDVDVDMGDEFDQPEEKDQASTDANMKVEDDNPEKREATGTDKTVDATYYAKNDDYDFKTQGHSNRRTEMGKLHQSNEFSNWEAAAKKEWAVVHAKFYIALPKNIRQGDAQHNHGDHRTKKRWNSRRDETGGRRGKQHLEKLPEQVPVIDVKSAESATLGTKFESTGRLNDRPRMRSSVKMNRIQGLTDNAECRGGPLFECKLYYRAEDVISGVGIKSDNDDDMDMDIECGIDREGDEDVSLGAYQIDKVNQVKQYHVENLADPQDAEEMLLKCQAKIKLSDNTQDIDELVKIYYSNIVKGHFFGSESIIRTESV